MSFYYDIIFISVGEAYEYHKLIALELEDNKKAGKRTSLGIRLDDILEKIDTQKAYYLTEDLEFREI